MNTPQLIHELDKLIQKYSEIDFSYWEIPNTNSGHRFLDCAPGNPDDCSWWQAETDVLEIVTDPDGRKWANISITLYPYGVHSYPPALSACMAIFDNGQVEGEWANGEKFNFIQSRKNAV